MKYTIDIPDDSKYAILTCKTSKGYYTQDIEFKKQPDEIQVGDVVDWDGDLFIVTYIAFDGLCGVAEDGVTYDAVLPENVQKTGRHFDIGDMLKGINWT